MKKGLYFYHFSHLCCVWPYIVWLVLVFLLHNGDARSRRLLCPAEYLLSTTLCMKEKKASEFLHTFLLLCELGIKPGPPAQQASALSIVPLTLGFLSLNNTGIEPTTSCTCGNHACH